MNVSALRLVTIEAETKGMSAAASEIDKVSAAENRLTSATQGQVTITEKQEKRIASVREAYQRQTMAVDVMARQLAQFERAQRIADQALNQGIITAGAHAQRIEMLQQRYGQTAEASTGLARATQAMSQAFQGATGILIGFAAGAVGALATFSKAAFDNASAISEQAEQAGVTVEAFQAYRAVMLTSGIATEQADQIMTRLTRSIGEAEAGGGKARDAFVQLGIGIDTLKQGAENTLPEIARGLLAIDDASQRARLEVDLFGKSGQRLESALRDLVDPTSTLVEKQKALGLVMGKDLTDAADAAADGLTQAWNRAKVGMAPGVTWLVEKLAQLTELNQKAQDWLNHSSLSAPIGSGYGSRAEYDAAQAAAANPAGISSLEDGLLINGHKSGYSTQSLDSVISKLKQEADLAGKSAAERARIVALRDAEAAKIKDGNGALTDAERLEVAQLAAVSANAEASRKAGEESKRQAKQQFDDMMKFDDLVTRLSNQNDEIGKRRKEAADKVLQDQRGYIESLHDEVALAGMGREEAERYSAVLRGVNQYHIEIGSAQAKEIEQTVALRQQTEKYRGVVDGIATGFQGFFDDVLTNGVARFGSLWDAIKQQFNSLLSYMAAQALVNPIIVPMVEGIYGLAPGSLGSGGGAMGALGALGNMGSMSSLFGGSSGGLLSSAGGWFNGLGNSLGFSSMQAVGLNAEGGLSMAQMPGSVFGTTTLGGFLGGAGAGSLASSLIFGNKNDAGLGGMGGSAIGAAIGSLPFFLPFGGPLVGGLIGGLLGGGLGSITGSSNQGAISNFTNNGLGNTLFKAGGGQNGQLATQATAAVNQIVQQLLDAGVNVAMGNISGISIGSDKSYVYGFDGMKEKLGGGDVQGVINSVLNHILPSANTSDSAVQEILGKYGSLNSGNVSQFVQEALAAKQQADATAQQLADFGPAIAKALKAIQDPIGAQYDDLIASQQARMAQAQQLGADLSQLDGLNNAELNKFLSGLSLDQMNKLAKTVDILGTSAYAAAQAAQQLADAQQQAAQDAADTAKRVQDAQATLTESYNSQLQTLQASQTQFQNLADSLRSYLGQIGGGSANPLAQYNYTRGIFSSTAALAQGGDVGALGRLQQVSTDFLNASKAASVSLSDYRRDRALVTSAVTTSATAAQAQADSFSSQIDALNKLVDGMIQTNKKLDTVAEAIEHLEEALSIQTTQTARNTEKVASLLLRVTRDGNALVTEAA